MLNKKFYSTTSSQKDDKYLSYITPIKPKKVVKITDIPNKNSFSRGAIAARGAVAMDIETIAINGKEIPISILIKTRNISKIL